MKNTIVIRELRHEIRELRHELHNLRKDYIAAVEQIQELQTKPAAKDQWIMVTHRLRGTDEPFVMGHAWSVTKLGAKEALQRAQDELARVGKCLPNIEARIEGDEF